MEWLFGLAALIFVAISSPHATNNIKIKKKESGKHMGQIPNYDEVSISKLSNAKRIYPYIVVEASKSDSPPEEVALAVVEHECNLDFKAVNPTGTAASGPYQIVNYKDWHLNSPEERFDLQKSTIGVYKNWRVYWKEIKQRFPNEDLYTWGGLLFLYHNQGPGFARDAINQSFNIGPGPSLEDVVRTKKFRGNNKQAGIFMMANRIAYWQNKIANSFQPGTV